MSQDVAVSSRKRGWRVFVHSAPVPEERWEEGVEAVFERLLEDPRVAGPVGSGREGCHVGAVVSVDAPDLLEAARLAAEAVSGALRASGLPPELELLEVEPEERELPPPSLLGASEAGEERSSPHRPS
jgi:hypothetical protein